MLITSKSFFRSDINVRSWVSRQKKKYIYIFIIKGEFYSQHLLTNVENMRIFE